MAADQDSGGTTRHRQRWWVMALACGLSAAAAGMVGWTLARGMGPAAPAPVITSANTVSTTISHAHSQRPLRDGVLAGNWRLTSTKEPRMAEACM
jgi:hypothetical protein